MNLKEIYHQYLIKWADQKFPLTKKHNQEARAVLANHRSTAGINLKQKEFCYTVIASGFKGSRLNDIDGNEFIDLTMGFGVHLFGHHPEFIQDAIQRANASGWGLGPMNPAVVELARGIQKLTGVEKMAFFNSGTEAVMVAIRIARAYTGKPKVVVFKGSYHGHSDTTLLFKTDPMSQLPLPLIPGVSENTLSDTYLLDYDDDESLKFIESHAHELAAVLVEPVQSRNPACQPLGFLTKLRALTKDKKIILLFDEMITGFRIHPGGAQKHFNIEADLVTYGKIIGGGMPIGVVAGKQEYINMIDGGNWTYGDDSLPFAKKTFVAGTFCNHPLTMASANTVVNKLLGEGIEITARLNETTKKFADDINAWMHEHSFPVSIDTFGSLFRFNIPSIAKDFFHQLLLEGVYLWEGKTCFFSTEHTSKDIEKLKARIKKVALTMRASGYFPKEYPRTVHHEKIHQACLNNDELSISLNIGVNLHCVTGISAENFELALRYVWQQEALFRSVSAEKSVQHLYCVSEKELETALQEGINTNILDTGILCSFIYLNGEISYIQFAVHKTFLDAWSLSVMIQRAEETYRCISKGDSLPQWSENPAAGFSVPGISPEQIKISGMENLRVKIRLDFTEIKKAALQNQHSVAQFISKAFIRAAMPLLHPEKTRIVAANPVALQLLHKKPNVLGSYGAMEAFEYDLHSGNITALSDSSNISWVINIDRFPSGKEPLFHPLPADPGYMRYDLVVNFMVSASKEILLDLKWRKGIYNHEVIQNILPSFGQSLLEKYVAAGS